MSFWGNSIGAVVDDGWEDDIELSDNDTDDHNDTSNDDESLQQSLQQSQTSNKDHNDAVESAAAEAEEEEEALEAATTITTTAGGGGVLLGRWTRMFEAAVTVASTDIDITSDDQNQNHNHNHNIELETPAFETPTLASRLTLGLASGLTSYLTDTNAWNNDNEDNDDNDHYEFDDDDDKNGWQEEDELSFDDEPQELPLTPHTVQISLGLGIETRHGWDTEDSLNLTTTDTLGWENPPMELNHQEPTQQQQQQHNVSEISTSIDDQHPLVEGGWDDPDFDNALEAKEEEISDKGTSEAMEHPRNEGRWDQPNLNDVLQDTDAPNREEALTAEECPTKSISDHKSEQYMDEVGWNDSELMIDDDSNESTSVPTDHHVGMLDNQPIATQTSGWNELDTSLNVMTEINGHDYDIEERAVDDNLTRELSETSLEETNFDVDRIPQNHLFLGLAAEQDQSTQLNIDDTYQGESGELELKEEPEISKIIDITHDDECHLHELQPESEVEVGQAALENGQGENMNGNIKSQATEESSREKKLSLVETKEGTTDELINPSTNTIGDNVGRIDKSVWSDSVLAGLSDDNRNTSSKQEIDVDSGQERNNGWEVDDFDAFHIDNDDDHQVLFPSKRIEGIDKEGTQSVEGRILTDKVQRSVAFVTSRQLLPSPHLVDHVPVDVPVIPHRDSTIAMGSTDSGSLVNDSNGDEQGVMDPDAQDFGPVVDHLPSPHPQRALNSRTASLVTQIQSADFDGTTEPDEQSTASSFRPLNGVRSSLTPPLPPPVVDYVPTDTPGLRYKDSTRAVASEQSSAIMEDVWREDFDPEDQDYGPVVDNVPTQGFPLLGRVAYRNIEASIEELDDESAEDEKKGSVIGIPSVASIAGSMDVFAPITEIDDDDDENTIDRMVTRDEESEAMSQDPPLENGIDCQVKEPQLVDHVPFRPESRANDTSTLGFADPSEGSTAGDLTHEENVYLPVVDHTPPPRPLMLPSTTESIIVVATKSECPEELEFLDDMAEDGRVTGDDDHDDDDDDGATLDTRSIGDQINDTKVVDHVPNDPSLRRINSDRATTDVQSIISTTSFGLVVDVIPMPVQHSTSRDSVAALATLSEVETLRSESILTEADHSRSSRMVDRLPLNSDVGSQVGSFMVMKSLISEDETLDDEQQDGYGPVVSAVPPSRGGSNHGLLATLSEVDFCTEAATVDGWESVDNDLVESVGDEELTIDQDFDITPETKNKAVSFRDLDQSPLFLKPPLLSGDDDGSNKQARYFDSIRSPPTLDENKYYEGDSKITADCSACAQSTSLDCPCVQRILGVQGNSKAAIVSVMSPEGVAVDIDYNKLLQTEVTKRLLFEKEIERYQAMFEDYKHGLKESGIQHNLDRIKLQSLEQSQFEMVSQLELERCKNSSLHEETENYADETTTMLKCIASLKVEIEEANDKAKALEQENEVLRCSGKIDSEKATLTFCQFKEQMSTKVAELETENNEFMKQVNALESNIIALQKQTDDSREDMEVAKNKLFEFGQKESKWSALESSRVLELTRAKATLSEFENKECEWLAKESYMQGQLNVAASSLAEFNVKERDWSEVKSALTKEAVELKMMVVETQLSDSRCEELGAQIASLKIELAGKCSLCDQLNAQVVDTECRLQDLEGRNFAHMKESVRVSKQHEVAVAKMSEELQTLSRLHEDELSSRDKREMQLESLLAAIGNERDQLKSQCLELSQAVKHKQSLLDEREKNEQSIRRDAKIEKAKLEARIKLLENEHFDSLREVEHSRKRLLEATDSTAIDLLKNENQVLQDTLLKSHDKLEEMETKIGKLSAERDRSFQADLQLSLLTKERDHLLGSVDNREKKISELESILNQTQKESATASFLNESSASLHATLQQAENALAHKVGEFSKKETELEVLRSAFDGIAQEHEETSEERDSLLILCHELENNLDETQRTFEDTKARLYVAEQDILAFQDQIQSLTAERSNIKLQCEQLEANIIANDELYRQQTVQLQTEMESRLLEASELCSSAERKHLASQNELVVGNRNTQALVTKVDFLEKQASEYDLAIANIRSDHEKEFTLKENELFVLSHQMIDLQSRISILQCELSKKDDTIGLLEEARNSKYSLDTECAVDTNHLRSRCLELEGKITTLDHERECVWKKVEQSELQITHLQESIDQVIHERDEALQAKELLEEENEELFVQLGLTKEQLESGEKDLDILHSELATMKNNSTFAEERIRHADETNQYLESELKEFSDRQNQYEGHNSGKSEELTHAVEILTLKNSDLTRIVEEMKSWNVNKAEDLRLMLVENKSLNDHLCHLHLEREDLVSNNSKSIQQKQCFIHELEQSLQDLNRTYKKQNEDLDRLTLQVRDSEAALSTRDVNETSFKQQITHLESVCADCKSIIQQQDLALDEMRRQLENLRHDASRSNCQALVDMSEQIDDITCRLQSSEHNCNKHIHRVKELELGYETAQIDLQESLEKVSCMEVHIANMDLELESKKNDAMLKDKYMAQVMELASSYESAQHDLQVTLEKLSCVQATLSMVELELEAAKEGAPLKQEYNEITEELHKIAQNREEQIAEMDIDRHDLMGQLVSLQADLESEREQRSLLLASFTEESEQNTLKCREIDSLKSTLLGLEQKLQSEAGQSERERSSSKEISKMRASAARKKDRIAALEQQLTTLSVELSSSQSHLVNKESELQKISIAFEKLRAEQLFTTQRVTLEVLGATTNKDAAESSDNMRTLIISLSKALENSESERAEAIECLLKERKANTDSLKRLGESVKRFYSTLNCAATP